jgi:hypothetical protein
MNAGHALGRANAHAFQKQLQDGYNLVLRQAGFVHRPRVLLGDGFLALEAAEAL